MRGRAHNEAVTDSSRDDHERLTQQALIDLETADSARGMRSLAGLGPGERNRDLDEREFDLDARRDVADSRDRFAHLRHVQQEARDAAADKRDSYLDGRSDLLDDRERRLREDRP